MVRQNTAKKSKSRVITIDWTDVEASGGKTTVPEGHYEVKVLEVTKETGSNSGEDYLKWELSIVSPEEYKGTKLYYNTSLQKKSLWNLRGVLEVLGMEIPDGPEDLDLDELVDRTAGVEVQHGEYNGKPKNEVVDFFEFKDESEEVAKSSKKPAVKVLEDEASKAKKSSKKVEVAYTDAEIMKLEEPELAALIEEHDLDVNLDDFNTIRRQRAAVVESLELAGLIAE